MSLSLSISGHALVMESLKFGPRVKAFKEENDSNIDSLVEFRRLHHQGVARD